MGHDAIESAAQLGRKTNRWRTYRALAIVLLLGVLAVRLTGVAESLFYWPTREKPIGTGDIEDVVFTTADGLELHAWFMPARGVDRGEPGPAILHAHGNAGNVESHRSFSEFLRDAGFHVFLFDYRGYGRSDSGGKLSRDALTMDTHAAVDALISRDDVDPGRVGVMGVSLGGAFALRVGAEDPRVRSVATLSAFSSWWRVANDAVPVLGWVLIPRGVEPEESAAMLGNRPLLVMHGMQDKTVRPHHAERLEAAAKLGGVAVERWTHPEAGHNDLVQFYADAQEKLIEFFKRSLSAR